MKIAVRAHALATLLDRMPDGIRTLSIDCFDTLLWRNTHEPSDVFCDLPYPGGAREARAAAEAIARRNQEFDHKRSEVSIEQIYDELLPHADAAARALAVQQELDAEARHCFAFDPTVALIRDAQARGLDIVMVSDTYLSAAQLRTLIARTAGQEVADAIRHIFASSEHGVSKSRGLFRHVLKALRIAPDAILHVGDNPVADQVAPDALGISTVHLEQFEPAVAERLRMEAMTSAMLDMDVRTSRPVLQPHRADLALRAAGSDAWTMGHDVLGPLMHGFAEWLQAEAAAMAGRIGRPVKLLFLMRDGYLPMQMVEALGGTGIAIDVSRLTARNASFINPKSVRRYIADTLPNRYDVVGEALMLNEAETRKLAGQGDPMQYRRAAVTPAMTARVVTRSAASADRMIAHFRARGVADGDAVMLVDLGYNGSVQNHIQPILEARMGLTVAGRYLLLREGVMAGGDKRGYLDRRHHDFRMLQALAMHIAVIEQMSTMPLGSVIDYTSEGEPIRAPVSIKGRQSRTRDELQAGCLAYATVVGKRSKPVSDDVDARRRMSAAILGRLLFLPSEQEVRVLEAFDHDVNCGVTDVRRMIDIEQSEAGLRRRGMQYVNETDRMYLPGELRSQGLPTTLSFFGINRFGLALRGGDFETSAISIPTIVTDGTSDLVTAYDAHPTHDGYHMMTVPVGKARFSAAIQFGELFEMIQVEEVSFFELEIFGKLGSKPISCRPVYDGAVPIADGVIRCGPGGLMFVEPPRSPNPPAMVLVVVFRPIIRRTGESVRQAA